MQVYRTVVDDVLLFVPSHDADPPDATATFDASVAQRHGIDPSRFIQESQSRSVRGVVRGLHGRIGAGEAKLVRCAHGAMHDIVVDARPSSPTFGRVASFLLDDTDMRQLYIPAGCLHGFQALTDTVDTCYRIDTAARPGRGRRRPFRRPGPGRALAAPDRDHEPARPGGRELGGAVRPARSPDPGTGVCRRLVTCTPPLG